MVVFAPGLCQKWPFVLEASRGLNVVSNDSWGAAPRVSAQVSIAAGGSPAVVNDDVGVAE